MKRKLTSLCAVITAAAFITGSCGSAVFASEPSESADSAPGFSIEEANENLTAALSDFQIESTNASGDLDMAPIQAVMANRGGLKLEIEKIEPAGLSEEEVSELDRAMRAYTPVEGPVIVNEAKSFYFYEQLNKTEQVLYDAIYLIAMDPTTTDNIVTLQSKMNPGTDEFLNELYLAELALGYDHPELWWIYLWNGDYYIDGGYDTLDDGTYTVYLWLNEPYENFEEDVTEFNEAVEEFIEDIDSTQSEAQIAIDVHDKLIEMAIYDYNVLDTKKNDRAHTAFGALVRNSSGQEHYCVCDGYSLAYTYILQQLGLEATVVTGMAGSDSLGGHAWSLVKIDGKWYEVDSTWDDYTDLKSDVEAAYPSNSIEYSVFMEMLSDSSYLNRLYHYLYRLSTKEITNYKAPDSLAYITKDGMYKITLVSDSEHIRFSDYADSKNNFQGALVALLPIAEGDLGDLSDLTGSTTIAPSKNPLTGTYYVVNYNGYKEDTLRAAWGDDYYLYLPMFDLYDDYTGVLYENGTSTPFKYSVENSTVTLWFNNGYLYLIYDQGTLTLYMQSGEFIVFGKMA